MKWFKRWLARAVVQGHELDEADPPRGAITKASRLVASRDQDWHENLNITITNANGGKIVAFRRYDHKTDRHDNKIYVVPDDHNFTEELGKLITLESMRN